jgi:hypothetical protein
MENSRNWKYWMGHKEWFLHRQLKNIEMQEIALTAKKAAIKLAVSKKRETPVVESMWLT